MAEPVLRDPVPPEPERRRGPQPVRAAKAKVSPSVGSGSKMPVEEVPLDEVPIEQVEIAPNAEGAAAPGPLSPEAVAVPIDPARELPPPPPDAAPASFADAPPKAPSGRGAVRAARMRSAGRRPPKGCTPPQEMLDELRSRLDALRDRVEKQASATGTSLKRELAQDADYVRIRARYYHERQPLQAVGMVAAGGFVLGLFLGLWRR